MSQEITPPLRRRFVLSPRFTRFLGIGLLALLLARLDIDEIARVMREANPVIVILAVVAIIPLILLKTIRWQAVLRSQSLRLALWPALLAYFGSLFIGFLTPGRLGEFIKAAHVSRDCDVSLAQAFSSVLADRLFDLYALVLVGSAALLSLAVEGEALLIVAGCIALLTVPLGVYLNEVSFAWIKRTGMRFGPVGQKLFADDGILSQVRAGLRQLTPRALLVAVTLTIGSYVVFFGQCYLLAYALDLSAGVVPVTFAVALGSLVTLIPVSISGLGTREAAMIAYLHSAGVEPEMALSFSLLVFVTFYVAGGLIGAAAWWIKPVPMHRPA